MKIRHYKTGSAAFWAFLAQPDPWASMDPPFHNPHPPGSVEAWDWDQQWEDALSYHRGDWDFDD